jgi:hypothetical protein
MNLLAALQAKHGRRTSIGYNFHAFFKELAERGECDACIVSTEDGFSPLGTSKEFFAADLGIPIQEIKRLADWNMSENERITLITLGSRRPGSLLRGIILAPGNNTRSYAPYVRSHYSRPHRDFYYNVSYETIAYACREWGARKLAISHLSGSGRFHEDIATCHAEALAHFCDGEPEAVPESFVFCGCCITADHLKGIERLNAEGKQTTHRPISVAVEEQGVAKLIHLSWQ